MALNAYHNSQVWNAKSLNELYKLAALEAADDKLLLVRKFGRSDALTANIAEDVWQQGGTKTLLTTADTLDVVSTSANDTAAGTGARVVLVNGLDEDYEILNELVVMNGTTPVTTTNSFLRVNRIRVVSSGTGNTNAGTVTADTTSGDIVQGTMPAGESITQQSHFTIPNGYTALTTGITLSVYRVSGGSGSRNAEIDQLVYVPSISTQYQTIRYGISSDNTINLRPQVPSQTPARTTVWFRATAEQNNTVVTSVQEILLVKGAHDLRTEI